MDKQILFSKFIDEFLPPRGNKRKYSGNEMDDIQSSLSKFFKQNFGYPLSADEILLEFNRKGYDIFGRGGMYDSDRKIEKPSGNSDLLTGRLLPSDPQNPAKRNLKAANGVQYIYIDIDPSMIRTMMRSLKPLPEDTSQEKMHANEELKRRVRRFKEMNGIGDSFD